MQRTAEVGPRASRANVLRPSCRPTLGADFARHTQPRPLRRPQQPTEALKGLNCRSTALVAISMQLLNQRQHAAAGRSARASRRSVVVRATVAPAVPSSGAHSRSATARVLRRGARRPAVHHVVGPLADKKLFQYDGALSEVDPEISALITKEKSRQVRQQRAGPSEAALGEHEPCAGWRGHSTRWRGTLAL